MMKKMEPLPEIEFIVAWRNYVVGERIRPNGMLRSFLIDNGLATLVKEKKRRGRKPRFAQVV